MSSSKEQKLTTSNDDDSTSSSDDDPFDFVAKYRKMENKIKKSKLNPKPINDHPSVVNNSTVSTDVEYVPNIIATAKTTNSSDTTMRLKDNKSPIPNSEEAHNNISQITTKNKRPNCRQSKTNKRKNGCDSDVVGPVICIGDFDDGYNIPPPSLSNVCSKPNKNDDEDDYCYELLNRVVKVGVYWCKSRVHRFPIRMFQTIESIYEYFAKLEEIETSQVSLTLRKKCLTPTDTPHSMNYNVADFIDGEIEYYKSPYDIPETSDIEEKQEEEEEEEEGEEEVTFRIKQKDVKHPIPISIKKTERMYVVYLKLAEKLGLDVESFTLEFDGDVIQKSDTMERLDLEGDECFELFNKKN